ncbi:MAG: phenylalanine--tRNA ligase subunit beta [Wenzhouxiangellaceae bacterium]|nr:phenylalanine--tRNA ligase subunit beta [Wenzhouxiangellaceae bacterium]
MRFSVQWLKQWVPVDLAPEDLAERLTAAGLEVDDVQQIGRDLDGVVVGHITACAPHPDADRLRVCTVEHGASEPSTIVCGAPNAREGLKAPLARPGTRLPDGTKIKPAKLRGVRSEGMLCSAPELGVGEDADGLLELPADAEAGTAVTEVLGLPDAVLELDLTPNRADCLSIRGIAREVAAIESLPFDAPEMAAVRSALDREIPIHLEAPAACPRYVGRIVAGVDPAARTPAWMIQRLERCGLRSLGPIVDVTNYVLLELGQPMHAFDLDRIRGGVHVRMADGDERITLLDDREIVPDEDMLLICDDERPLALAGIMGGRESAVGDGTRDILLESAWFAPEAIAGRARRLGLSTDSSHRFERGVDPGLQMQAVERATRLIVDIAGGRPGPVIEATDAEHLPGEVRITLRPERVNRLLGTELDGEAIAALLRRLHMDVEAGSGEDLAVVPPTSRRDLESEIDLVEEVARMVGYDALPSRAPRGRLRVQTPSETDAGLGPVRATLQARGFQEIMTWSFVSADELGEIEADAAAQPLANPLSRDLAVLRTTLLPGLLRTADANLRHQQRRIRLFETGHVFLAGDEGFDEPSRLGLLLAGPAGREHWGAQRRVADFHDLKGEIEHLVTCLGHGMDAMSFTRCERPWLHPGQAAELALQGRPAGWLGQLHPALSSKREFDDPVFVAELDLGLLRGRGLPQYSGLARFPSVRRDLALIVPERVEAARLERTARDVAGERLEGCIIFDVYQGTGIESGYKSIAIGLIFREVSRTLKDQEVDELVSAITERLAREWSARLRG